MTRHPLMLSLSASLLLAFTSLAVAQTRPRPEVKGPMRTELIHLKYIGAHEVAAIFGGRVVDGRPNYMNMLNGLGGLNNMFRPYGSMSGGGYQTTTRSPFGGAMTSLPGTGTQWGTVGRVGANQGLGRGAAAGLLSQPGVFPGAMQDMGYSLLGWPQTDTVILFPKGQ